MTNAGSSKFEDDSVNDDELLATFDDITSKESDSLGLMSNLKTEVYSMKYFVFFVDSPNIIVRFSL